MKSRSSAHVARPRQPTKEHKMTTITAIMMTRLRMVKRVQLVINVSIAKINQDGFTDGLKRLMRSNWSRRLRGFSINLLKKSSEKFSKNSL